MNNKPTMYGLQMAVQMASDLLATTDKSDLEATMQAKESLRKAKENLRIFSYKQKAHFTPNGRVIRA